MTGVLLWTERDPELPRRLARDGWCKHVSLICLFTFFWFCFCFEEEGCYGICNMYIQFWIFGFLVSVEGLCYGLDCILLSGRNVTLN